jgi:selenoprotein W-related protein
MQSQKDQLRIVYCVPCGFLPRAISLSQEVLARLGPSNIGNLELVIEPGKDGVFDVYYNGKLIFSRFKEKRFPDINDILSKILHNT